jgi:hypothetical protein
VAETAGSAPSAQTSRESADGRARLIVLSVVFLMLGAAGGYFFGIHLVSRDLQVSSHTIQQLTDKVQQLEGTIAEQNAKNAALQVELKKAHATMVAMVPSENTYEISPNHSIIAAGGHLTIGLVGSPSDKSIDININGKQLSATAGDVVKMSPNPSTNCRITVQSFDMFKAVISARCETANAR